MKNSVKRSSVVIGFLALLLVLAANALLTRRQVAGQIEAHYSVEHTQQVLQVLTLVESDLVRAERAQRGFLYTGDERYLEPYKQASTELESHINRVSQLTADNPAQQARIPHLRELVLKKLGELDETIELYRAGNSEQAKDVVETNFGLFIQQKVHALLDEMESDELALQSHRAEAYNRSVQRTIASVYLTTLVAALGLGLLAFYILRVIRLRERHGEQLRQREEWFRVTLTSIGDGVIATDEKGRVTFINTVAEQLTGVTLAESKGRDVQNVMPLFNETTQQPIKNPVTLVMQRGTIIGLANHTVLKRRDGALIPIEDSAAPIHDDKKNLIGVVLVFRDASKERNAQEVLRKTEKLATAARLAATVAHEINNPLEAVGNLLYLARSEPGLPPMTIESLQSAEQELGRVAHITRQTLGFYRETGTFETVEMSDLVESVLEFFDKKVRNKRVRLEKHLEPCEVYGKAGELRQLASNLISNAIDAVAQGGAVKLEVLCVNGAHGPTVRLSVEDDGPGIDPRHLEHIFEPFFTTKKDVGTGLGLWVAKQIVQRHDGSILAEMRGQGLNGAKFIVTLPARTVHHSEIALTG